MTKADIKKSLEILREDYKNKLPDKINQINEMWQNLLDNPNLDNVTLFHFKIHNLHGASGTYGFTQLSEHAKSIENLIKPLLDKPDQINQISTQVTDLLKSLSSQIDREDKNFHIFESVDIEGSVSVNRSIYLLDDDLNWGRDLSTKIAAFSYQMQKFENVDLFIEHLTKQNPGVLIINIKLVDEKLHEYLIALKEKTETKIHIAFISNSGEFSLRLKAVRMGGEAFFIKPFSTDDLIKKIEHLIKPTNESYRILIIDDDAEVADYYATILEQANMKTSVINKSRDIDLVLHEFQPDLILTDIYMPDCNGLELAAIIRQQSLYLSTPIIYLSSEDDELKQISAMKLGADGFITKSTNPILLVMLIRNRIERYKQLVSLMVSDNLTGLYNRSFILDQLTIEFKKSLQLHNPLSIALIDIDRFKKVNDNYGHQAGDQVLKSLGLMIKNRLHANDLVGRFDSEKFLVVMPNTTADSAKSVIDELRQQFLKLNYSWDQQIFNATFSAGIASFPEFHTTSDLLQATTESLEKAKNAGRNRVEVSR